MTSREFFTREVYGRLPEACGNPVSFEELEPERTVMDGKAIRTRIRVRYRGPGGEGSFPVTAFIPTQDGGWKPPLPCPGFVYVNIFTPEHALDPEGRIRTESWPIADLVERGFAAIGFNHWEVVPDEECGYAAGAYTVLAPNPSRRTAESGGALALWAWAASKVMDWIEAEPRLDARRMAIIGHSRGGKTALWCGANDPRFALVISNESGCAGAKLNAMDLPDSEGIERISRVFPYWFCANFQKYAHRDREMPFDQDALLSLIAPRLLYVASAANDAWAGPEGEYEACRRAVCSGQWSGISGQGDGRVGYHVRPGGHGLRLDDWTRFMDFFEKNIELRIQNVEPRT
ncbi:MAG: alpha/beta hydrolase-fold protein [Kiritimatiellaeota bacterium]|nr:alpha/beta hydrolase-fold protein [Kiritimatiellota bacterium]